MKRIRLGNTIDIVWEIFLGKDKDKGKYDLTGKKLTIYLVSAFDRIKISDFTTEFNVLRFTFEGKDQKHQGRYQLTFVENEGGDDTRTLDKCDAFELVKGSCKETDDLSEITLASSFDALRIYPIVPQVGPNGNWWVDGVDTGNPTRGEKGDVVDASYMEFDVDDDMNLNLTFISTNDQLSLDFEIDENGYLTVDK